MAKIYNLPGEFTNKVPEFDFKDTVKQRDEKEEKFLAELKAWLNKQGYNEEHTGEEIEFPVADGHARYMVASVKPVMLIHLPLNDAWSFQYAANLTKKDESIRILFIMFNRI